MCSTYDCGTILVKNSTRNVSIYINLKYQQSKKSPRGTYCQLSTLFATTPSNRRLNRSQTHTPTKLRNVTVAFTHMQIPQYVVAPQYRTNTADVTARMRDKEVNVSRAECLKRPSGRGKQMCNLTAATAFPPQILPSLIDHQ